MLAPTPGSTQVTTIYVQGARSFPKCHAQFCEFQPFEVGVFIMKMRQSPSRERCFDSYGNP